MAGPLILFVPDSGAEIGGGHVMRSLTLAHALEERGARCVFLSTPPTGAVLDAFDGGGLERIDVPELPPEGLARAAGQIMDVSPFGAAVVDHFRLGAGQQGALRGEGRTVMVIDDLADRPLSADLLLDPSLGRTAPEYAAFAPEAELLLGPQFALVRPEFPAARQAALARRGAERAVQRVLVSLGLTDVGGVTARVLGALREELRGLEADVVIGARAPSRSVLEALARGDSGLTLHVETDQMARLMTMADLAIGAGGSSTWERATLGLPTLTVVLAENQAWLARKLESEGLALSVDARRGTFEDDLRAAFRRLLSDGALPARLAERTAAMCDGRGAARAAERLLARL